LQILFTFEDRPVYISGQIARNHASTTKELFIIERKEEGKGKKVKGKSQEECNAS
jgi:hypothetical protein